MYSQNIETETTNTILDLAQFLRQEARLPEPLVQDLASTLSTTTSYQKILAEMLSDPKLCGADSIWKGYNAQGPGYLCRALREIGEQYILSKFVSITPALSDYLAEGVYTRAEGNLLHHISGYIGQEDRYGKLADMYQQAIADSPVLAENIAYFDGAETKEKIPDYARFLVQGIFRPAKLLGHGLNLQNNSAVRKLGGLIDHINEKKLPSDIKAVGLKDLEEKEVDLICAVIDFAAIKYLDNLEISAKSSLENTSVIDLGTTSLPNGFKFLADSPPIRSLPSDSRQQLLSEDEVVIAAVPRRNRTIILSSKDAYSYKPNGYLERFLDRDLDTEVFANPNALSPSGRYIVGIDHYLYLTDQGRKLAQANQPSFECVDVELLHSRSFEPSEKNSAYYERVFIKHDFSWRLIGDKELVVLLARDLPRVYINTFEHQKQGFNTFYFDLGYSEKRADWGDFYSETRANWGELSPGGRWLAAISQSENAKCWEPTIHIFDGKDAAKGEYSKEKYEAIYDKKLYRIESELRPTKGFFTSDERLLLLKDDNTIVGEIVLETDRRGFENWQYKELAGQLPQCASHNMVLSPSGKVITIVTPNEVLYLDASTLKTISTTRNRTPNSPNFTSLRYSPTGYQLLIGDDKGGVWELDVEY